MSERIDIANPLRAICDALGVTYEDVSFMEVTPGEVKVVTLDLNENGNKFIGPDGSVAQTERLFKVTT